MQSEHTIFRKWSVINLSWRCTMIDWLCTFAKKCNILHQGSCNLRKGELDWISCRVLKNAVVFDHGVEEYFIVLPVSHTHSEFKALFARHDYSELRFCSQRCQMGGKDTLDGNISWRETGEGVEWLKKPTHSLVLLWGLDANWKGIFFLESLEKHSSVNTSEII